ncbi:DUF3379 family protein [Thalassomonas sp. M1454]|uniref:DUF3379 family protein n=1 Tax=Thalassomonas sp. M1454 TaxID=2594477 RepID=UPI00117BF7DB|nr:DUF3379 family protein [Thalassomonas sp. M1454]TRX57390.1 DUF3379 domain-containing protein [Thalassomonas sp. M1454]
MDELELRRRLYANPNDDSEELKQALADDKNSREFAKELKLFDEKIASALDVDVPENLANKLILRQSLHSHQVTKKKSRIHLAMAASVAFMVGLGVTYLNFSPAHTNIADYSLAHYHHEAGSFPKVANANYSLASINNEMENLNVSFIEKVGRLISVDGCFFDGMDSMHLVFEGEYDNITVFIIPQAEHLAFDDKFSDDTIQGISKKYPNGEVIIMGDKKEALDLWQEKIDSSIQWSI